ncbi:synaptonemal complex protein 3-like [Dasypus novemcinctus]|uniref:synaptonemal complex protein 3-like n=1 Tax=Dasypus novemcinctus TaxID=9361 RepID=UPI00265E834B|nr:synaptonemal complex protein 3-like [Dasypus novemcinctus]
MASRGRKRVRKSGTPAWEEAATGAPDRRREDSTGPRGAGKDGPQGKTPGVDKRGEKTPPAETTEEAVGDEVRSMLERLGDDITQSLLAKRKRFEMKSNALLNTSNQKIEHAWRTQHQQRENLNYEYSQQFSTLFHQWHIDVQKAGEQEKKLKDVIRQQQKIFQQSRIIQSQRLKAFEKLHEQFMKSIEDMERSHENLCAEAYRERKEEMALLQKTIWMETQKQEMALLQLYLQSLLL